MRSRFEVEQATAPSGATRYVVLDNGVLLPGRFHTAEQANAWVTQRLDKLARADPSVTGMRSRARAHLITASLSARIAKNAQPDAGY